MRDARRDRAGFISRDASGKNGLLVRQHPPAMHS
jgi:hypothetical protein